MAILSAVAGKIQNLLSPDWIGIYFNQNGAKVCDISMNQCTPIRTVNIVGTEESNVVRLVSEVLKGCKGWLRPRVLICSGPGCPPPPPDFLRNVGQKIRCSQLLSIDWRMCAALGAGITVTDFSKTIVVTLTKDSIDAYLVFGACIYCQQSVQMPVGQSLNQAIQSLVDRIESVNEGLPVHFENLGLKDEDSRKLRDGWSSPCGKRIFVIGTWNSPIKINDSFSRHDVVSLKDLEPCIESGLLKIFAEVSMLPLGVNVGASA